MSTFDSSLNEIIFEQIDDTFAYGKYADFKVIIMKENRYINATKLCSEYGKQFKHWAHNDNSKELISEVDAKINKANYLKSDNPSFVVIRGGKQDKQYLCGTYVHELLIPHIASWISPKFGIMVSEIVNRHIINQYNRSIREKDDKIDELMKKLDESERKRNKQYKKMMSKLDDSHVKLDIVNGQLSETNDILSDTNTKLKHVSKKLDIAVEDRVPKVSDNDKLEQFVLLKNRRKKADFKYYAVRGQSSYVSRKIAYKINDKYKEILRINNVANSVNLWCAFRQSLKPQRLR